MTGGPAGAAANREKVGGHAGLQAANRERRAAGQRTYRAANRAKVRRQQERPYDAANREKMMAGQRVDAAKRRVAADPMRHWISPPCS